jgi:RHS repeat-associated protein
MRTVAYTASNMTASISEGAANLALSYDPEHARILQSATIAGAVSTTTYLNDPASNVMTETVHITGKNTWKTYIVADGKIVGLRTTVNGQPAIDMKYFIHDHLGSIAVVTDGNKYLADGITLNPAYATAIERDAYDAWGKARVAATGADDTSCLLPGQSVTTRGFTGQEEMPSVCLVNYNARIYDPALGKFMTPDDMIPDAYRGQDYNRYTYVGDNPLSYDDPTGHYANTNSPSMADLSAPVTHNPFSTLADPIGSVEELAALLRVIQHAHAVGLTSDTASAAGLTSNSLQSPSTATSPGGGTNTGNTSAGDAGDPMANSPQAQLAANLDAENASTGAAYGPGQKARTHDVPASGGYSLPGYSGIEVYGDNQNHDAITAEEYDLKGIPGAAEKFQAASDKGLIILVGFGYFDQMRFDGDQRVVEWDPHGSLVDKASLQSITPSLAMFDEIDHASISRAQWDINRTTDPPSGMNNWKNSEEFRVHGVDEQAAAKALGSTEGQRTSIFGPSERVDSPTDHWHGMRLPPGD